MNKNAKRVIAVLLLILSPLIASFVINAFRNNVSLFAGFDMIIVAIIGIPVIAIIGLLTSMYNKGTEKEASIVGYVVPAVIVIAYQVLVALKILY